MYVCKKLLTKLVSIPRAATTSSGISVKTQIMKNKKCNHTEKSISKTFVT